MTRNATEPSPVAAPEADFFDSPIFKLMVASSLLARPFNESIGPERDLTLPEWRAMVALHARGGLSNIEVSELTGLDAMTVSRALDRLRRNGRVGRSRDEQDGRRQINSLTASGRNTYRAVVKLARQRQDAMTSELSQSDVRGLERTLDTIILHLKGEA
jgi:DNA-binding MarR family transcriptional regulator